MLRPSYSELMDILRRDEEMDEKITRYSIVVAASKRARQIINGAPCDKTGAQTDKAVSIAVQEMRRGLIKVFPEGLASPDTEEESPKTVKPQSKTKPSHAKITEKIIDLPDDYEDGIYGDDDNDGESPAVSTADDYNSGDKPRGRKKGKIDDYGYESDFDDDYSNDDYDKDYDDEYEDDYDDDDGYKGEEDGFRA